MNAVGFSDFRIEPLGSLHLRAEFSCGVAELDHYLIQQAGQDQKRGLATVFVLANDAGQIAGFYTLTASSILASELPYSYSKKLPRLPVPVTLLGRMAVSILYQGAGFGAELLMDALERSLMGSRQVASWAVIVDAKSGAKGFYLKYEFVPLDSRPDRLFITMKTIEALQGKF